MRRRYQALLWTLVLTGVLLVPAIAFADPLDDLGAKLGAFLNKAGLIAAGLIVPGGGLAVTVLALRRQAAKSLGDEETMMRSNATITDVLKWTAVGAGASLLTAVAGSILV